MSDSREGNQLPCSDQDVSVDAAVTSLLSGDKDELSGDGISGPLGRRTRPIADICLPAPSSPDPAILPEDDPTPSTPKSPGIRIRIEDVCVTPTSPRHRIPPPTTCPPAPRRPRGVRERKRKVDEGEIRRIDVSLAELETLFRPISGAIESVDGSKRIRRG